MSDRHFPDPEIIPPSGKKRSWKTPLIVAGALALGLTGAAATAAIADGGFGPGMWRHGWHHGFRDRGPADPAELNLMIERGVRHLAIEIDATPEQQAKLIEIAQSAAADLRPLREQLRDAREKGRQLLVSPTLDRAAIESFRAEQMALVDRISQRVAQAVGDAAEVLTAQQRAEIGRHLERFGSGDFGRGFHRGWRRG